MSMEIQVAAIGLAGAVIGGLISSLIPWWKEASDHAQVQERTGRYSAIRLVAVLELYAEQCADVVSDDGTCEGRPAGRTEQGEEYYDAQVATPELPSFPGDVDWQSIGAKSGQLMYEILALPNVAREANRYISSAAEHAFPPDYDEFFSARHQAYAYLGAQALSLAKSIRKSFALPEPPQRPWDWGWDAEAFFQDKLKEANQRNRTIDSSLP